MKNPRGCFQRPPNSGIWWINYYVNGKQHREKAGSKSAAKDLYHVRKAAQRLGEKMPDLTRRKVVTVSDLIDDALEFTRTHNADNYEGKAAIVRAALGEVPASALTPQEISRWLQKHCKTPATSNRYKAFISLCYREGIANGKVTGNPARLVRMKREANGRLRFLSREESAKLEDAIKEVSPNDLPAYLVAIHTGMRLSEQFRLRWGTVRLDAKVIDLTKTKNGCPRIIPLNSIALAALQGLWDALPVRPKAQDFVFTHYANCLKPDVRPWFPDALQKAGIEGFTWHGLRHTFCSWMAMAGVSLKAIQEVAGHKTLSMTARYAHLSSDHKASEIERIVGGGMHIVKQKRA
jgi:integrase